MIILNNYFCSFTTYINLQTIYLKKFLNFKGVNAKKYRSHMNMACSEDT